MYFGSSAVVDFALCTGLGVAAASCAAAAINTVDVIASAHIRDGSKNVLRVVVFLLGSGALMSIAAFIGATRSMRDADSILGFVVGVLAVVLLGLLVRRIRQIPQATPNRSE
jgi:uncharacterized membrane protein YfcA